MVLMVMVEVEVLVMVMFLVAFRVVDLVLRI